MYTYMRVQLTGQFKCILYEQVTRGHPMESSLILCSPVAPSNPLQSTFISTSRNGNQIKVFNALQQQPPPRKRSPAHPSGNHASLDLASSSLECSIGSMSVPGKYIW